LHIVIILADKYIQFDIILLPLHMWYKKHNDNNTKK